MNGGAVAEPPELTIGLIGLGAIGQSVVEYLSQQAQSPVRITSALVRDTTSRTSPSAVPLVTRLDDLLAERPDIVVEVAGHSAVRAYAAAILDAGVDLLIVSVGALADRQLEDDLRSAARRSGRQLQIASGGIGALDVIGAARIGGLQRVSHTTRKPPRTLLPLDDALQLREPRVIFSGSARDGALQFPESANVAAAVSLAGLGFDQTRLEMVADPGVTRNTHQLEVVGSFGSMRFEIENIPSERNPRSARLAAMSVTHAVLRRRAEIMVG
jgi:aspartate dehydrogenase